jgi:hypothetical protein
MIGRHFLMLSDEFQPEIYSRGSWILCLPGVYYGSMTENLPRLDAVGSR